MERMGWDNQMRDLKAIGQVHVRAGQIKRMGRSDKRS